MPSQRHYFKKDSPEPGLPVTSDDVSIWVKARRSCDQHLADLMKGMDRRCWPSLNIPAENPRFVVAPFTALAKGSNWQTTGDDRQR